ncbi:O-acyltransferase family protein, putative isoform 1 [Theobroma cacao]|uniref:O-acyltransferase family protein, putative isoform 1 n=1 Tax=Theobroma cacao TaxID=3641 RepID=A0A061E0Z2_THECC|nr:O-acyltransferase family protein, putative isoform 1 [Theobroma cacao]EOX98297.1 O-acyltransferase family protein, putative isoform 1 [Theobroma cacao]
MACPGTFSDEPLTPAGRLFLQSQTNIIIHCILRGKNPIDIDAVKSTLRSSLMVRHPRFCSLLVRDKNGFEHWRKAQVDIDQHVIVIDKRLDKSDNFLDESRRFSSEEGEGDDDDEAAVNQYVADLSVSSPLSTDKPLWEIHILVPHKCAVFRIHHALGDGISLMSMLMASCRRADDADALPRMVPEKSAEFKDGKGRDWFWLFGILWGFLKMVCFTVMFVMEFVVSSLLVCDRKTVISGGEGVELWPRKLATARFLLEDMRVVKKAIPNTTINDVLFGVVSSGLSRYLDHRTPNALHEGLRMTGVAMVNLRPQTGFQDLSQLMKGAAEARWGNKFGLILLPVYFKKAGNNPLEYVKRAKRMVDRKKHSLEAYFSYRIGDLVMSLLGSKYACLLNYRLLCNTTFTISNIIGPLEEITLAGNPISSIKVNTSSLPQAITMHMLSYAGRAEMQILVAKDIVPDPEFLAKCFEDALLEMKEAVIGTEKE